MSIWIWIGFFVLVLAMLAIDLGVTDRHPHEIKIKEALVQTAIWISVSLLFCFGIFTRRTLRERAVVAVVVAAPALCLLLQRNSERWFGGYTLGYEVMILNALLTFVGLWAISRKPTSNNRA